MWCQEAKDAKLVEQPSLLVNDPALHQSQHSYHSVPGGKHSSLQAWWCPVAELPSTSPPLNEALVGNHSGILHLLPWWALRAEESTVLSRPESWVCRYHCRTF